MSSDTVQAVTTEPAPVAQTPVEIKGAIGESDFARRIAAKQVAYQFQSPPPIQAEAKPPAEAPVTQEAKEAPIVEAKPEETKTEAVTPAEPAEETKEEAPEVLSPENHNLDPKLQEILDKRIGKEVAKREKLKQRTEAAEARAAELEAKLAQQPTEVEKEVPVPVPANVPLAEITTIEQLNTYKENLQNDIVEAEMLLYSDFPAEGKMTKWGHITKDGLISALTQAKKDERLAIPAREKFLTTRTQSMQTAIQKFPFLKDPTHPGYQMAKQALRDNPILRNYPNSDYLVGMLVKGQMAMQSEEAASKVEVKSPAKPKPKPTSGQSEITSDASIQRAPVGVLGKQALDAEIATITGGKKSLGHKDFAAILAAKSRFRNSH
jgi:hypothetical protein